MKDAFGKNMQVGDEAVHFFAISGKTEIMRVTITGFTPQRVRFAWQRNGREFSTLSVPTNFAIVPPGFDEHGADRPD